jgi:hypothetical protein
MRSIKLRWAIAFAAICSLAIPASALAHPQVYSLTPKKTPSGCTFEAHEDGSCLEAGTVRYAIANDGYSMTFTETAGSNPSRGIINYQLIPSGFRTWKVGEVTHKMTALQLLEFASLHGANTTVQPHATCDLAVLNEPATIASWQEAEPFFNYVPWQKVSAGLGDEPSSWIPVVQEKMEVDLATLPSDDPATKEVNEEAEAAKTLCEGKGGTYYKADTGSNPATGAIAEAVEGAVVPLEAEIGGLLSDKSSLQSQIGSWKTKATTLEGEKAALAGEVNSLNRQLATVKKASAKRAKTIKQLRKQLKAARQHG